jgi:hypothetical protein
MTPQLPTAEAPAAIAAAVKTRAERAADLARAQGAVREARIAAETAVAEDRRAYAAARDARKGDPGPAHERAARERLADAERREAGEAMRLAAAEDALQSAIHEHVDDWAARIAKKWGALDREAERVLAELEEVEAKRTQLRQLGSWLAELQQSGDPARPVPTVTDETALADGRSADAFLAAGQLRAALREHVAATSAQVFAQGAAARAEARRAELALGELRADPNPAVQAAAIYVGQDQLSFADALAIRDGQLELEEALEQARLRRAQAQDRGAAVTG